MSVIGNPRRKYLLLAPILVLTLLIFGYPFVRTISLGFFKVSFGGANREFVGLDHFVALVSSEGFWSISGQTIVWALANLLIQLSVPVGIAMLLNQKLRGINVARALVLLPWVVPVVPVAVTMRWMLLPRVGIIAETVRQFGFGDVHFFGNRATAMAALVIINSWKFIPFGTLMILSALQTIPTNVYEAAKVDGCGGWSRFRYITFPYIGSMIWFVGFLAFAWNFNTFDLIWLTTAGGPGSATETLPVTIYRTAFRTFRLGEAAASASFIAIILIILGYFYFRSFTPKDDLSQ
jgi:multiple sugar transport system permease protein